MGRFIIHKTPQNNFIVEDTLGIIPILFFSDLTSALRCKDELNRIVNVKEEIVKLIALKEEKAMNDSNEYLNLNQYYSPVLEERIRIYRSLQEELKENL